MNFPLKGGVKPGANIQRFFSLASVMKKIFLQIIMPQNLGFA